MKIHINAKGEWTLSQLEWEQFDALRDALKCHVATMSGSRYTRRVRRLLLAALDDASAKVWSR